MWLQITTRSEITLIYQRLLIYGHHGDISCENMLIHYIMLAYFYNILCETKVPDKDTTSVTSRPTFLNLEVILYSESNAEGSDWSVPFMLIDTNPSRLPYKTLHVGPPLCKPLQNVYGELVWTWISIFSTNYFLFQSFLSFLITLNRGT